MKKADTLAGLAAELGVDPAGLQASVARMNEFARNGRDLDFHRGEPLRPLLRRREGAAESLSRPARDGAYYGLVVYAGDLGTKGGLKTDPSARVLRDDGSVIPGLFAIGNCSASVMGRDVSRRRRHDGAGDDVRLHPRLRDDRELSAPRWASSVETGLLNPDTAQYAGKGQAKPTIADIAAAARATEALGFDGVCAPEAGHDPFLPLTIARRAHDDAPPRHQRGDRVSAEPDGDGAARLGPAAALGRPLQPRPRHAGEGSQRAPLRDAVDGGPGPASPRVPALPPARCSTASRPESRRRSRASTTVSACCRPSSTRARSTTPRPRSTSPRSTPTWRGSAASSATVSACTRSAPSRTRRRWSFRRSPRAPPRPAGRSPTST